MSKRDNFLRSPFDETWRTEGEIEDPEIDARRRAEQEVYRVIKAFECISGAGRPNRITSITMPQLKRDAITMYFQNAISICSRWRLASSIAHTADPQATDISESYTSGALIVGTISFIASWIYAIATYGFFLGVGLGWIPSLVIGFLAGLLWPLIGLVLLTLIGVFFILALVA